jgi:hypothetical protein
MISGALVMWGLQRWSFLVMFGSGHTGEANLRKLVYSTSPASSFNVHDYNGASAWFPEQSRGKVCRWTNLTPNNSFVPCLKPNVPSISFSQS